MNEMQHAASLGKVCTAEGYLEDVISGELEGWIWNAEASNEFLCVEVIGPSCFYCRASANAFRQDLQDAAKNNGHCAFRVPLPNHLLSASSDQFIVLLDGTGHRLRPVGDFTDKLMENWLDQHGASIRAQILVQRNSYDILGRAPTVEELGQWMPLVSDRVTSLSTLVRTIASVRSPQIDVLEGYSIEAVVRSVYLGILKRDAEPRGIQIYSEALRNGMSLAEFIGELTRTPEFMARIGQPSQHGNSVESRRLAAAMERAMLTLAIGASAQNDKPGSGVTVVAQQPTSLETVAGAALAVPGRTPKGKAKSSSRSSQGASLDRAAPGP